jgi:hypothetical protein
MNTTATAPVVFDRSQLAGLRLIPPIEKYPKLVLFVQTGVGKITAWGLFVLGLWYFFRTPLEWIPITVSLLLITVFPKWRWNLIAACTLATTAIDARSLYFLAAIAVGALLFWCARRWPDSEFSQRPVAYLVVGCTLLIVVCSTIPRNSSSYLPAWRAVGLATTYLWFVGYALMDRAAIVKKDLPLELGTFHPFWGSTNTPFPKGAAYLRRIEAKDDEQLAVTRLKGLKLLTWAILLALFNTLWTFFFHKYLHIPWASQVLAASVQRGPYPWYICWESQVLSFFEYLLQITVFGHWVIASCRFAGFNALRNTYRPLSAVTVIEFFNRFYYYFKELLVDFFFYPTFFRYFKKHPRLRLVAATFAAAAFGNMFFHFTRDYWMIPRVGFVNAIVNFQVYAFYCVALATALSISQLRRRKTPRLGFLRGRAFPAVWVIFFYCVLDVFGSTERNYPLLEHFRLLGHMFGVNF